MTKITKSTVKSFIKKNISDLYMKEFTYFNGMTDGIDNVPEIRNRFITLTESSRAALGVETTYNSPSFFESHNSIEPVEGENFTGFEITNCCGRYIIAARKDRTKPIETIITINSTPLPVMKKYKGIPAYVYRSDYDCTLNALNGRTRVIVTGPGIDEVFESEENEPVVILLEGAFKGTVIAKVINHRKENNPSMFGGTYLGACDSRINRAIDAIAGHHCYGAIPIHDRYED